MSGERHHLRVHLHENPELFVPDTCARASVPAHPCGYRRSSLSSVQAASGRELSPSRPATQASRLGAAPSCFADLSVQAETPADLWEKPYDHHSDGMATQPMVWEYGVHSWRYQLPRCLP